jgi:hypothetical protein
MTTAKNATIEQIKFYREALDRADALASVQDRAITVLEGALAVYSRRVDELERRIKIYEEAP